MTACEGDHFLEPDFWPEMFEKPISGRWIGGKQLGIPLYSVEKFQGWRKNTNAAFP